MKCVLFAQLYRIVFREWTHKAQNRLSGQAKNDLNHNSRYICCMLIFVDYASFNGKILSSSSIGCCDLRPAIRNPFPLSVSSETWNDRLNDDGALHECC